MFKFRSIRGKLILLSIFALLVSCGSQGSSSTPALQVTGTSPLASSTNVSLGTTVSATFNMAPDQSTIDSRSFTLSTGITPVIGSISFVGNTATFTPDAPLQTGTLYTASLKSGVLSTGGNRLKYDLNWTFTTISTTAPSVLSVTPPNGSTSLAIDTTVSATFSVLMNTVTIDATSFRITETVTGSTVDGALSFSGQTATFTPSASLANSKSYTVTLLASIEDENQEPMGSAYTWSFTTADLVDSTAPTVTSVIPADVTSGISVTSPVSITFSEDIAEGSINVATVKLASASSLVSGTIVQSGNTVIFTPSAALGYNTAYTLTVTTGATDLTGNNIASDYVSGFTTESLPDNEAPTVISITPSAGAAGVAVDSNITATFSEAMNSASVTGNFTLKDAVGNPVAGAIVYDGTAGIFNPTASLDYDTTYTATLSFNMTDTAGNALSLYTFSFTTVSAPDVTAPTVSSKTPAAAATNISIASPVSVTFSESMSADTLNAATFKLSSASGLVGGTIVALDETAIFTPSAPLAYNTAYTATITSSVADIAGINMAAPDTWTFTTEIKPDSTIPTVISSTPTNNVSAVALTSNITVTFSEAMDSASVTAAGNFTLKDSLGGNVAGAVTYDGTSAIFNPTAVLAADTAYTATLSWNMTDTAGNALTLHALDFTTGSAPDVAAPTVGTTTPGAVTGVSISSPVSVTFSEDMDPENVNAATFKLSSSSGLVAGTVTAHGDTAILTPNASLAYETVYTVTITTDVADLAGNNMAALNTWSFTTETEADKTVPTVAENSPSTGAANVLISSNITATFSEAMDSASITTAGNFTLKDSLGGNVAGAVTYDGTSAIFNPTAVLAADTTYTATLLWNMTDTAGNALSLYTFSFTTGSASDSVEPTVSSKLPDAAATGVSIIGPVSVTFSEDMDPDTVNAATFTLSSASGLVAGTITNLGDTVIFTPSAPLAYSTVYTVTITTGVADLADNSMAAPSTWSFTTEGEPDKTVPTVVGTTPSLGGSDISIDSDIIAAFSEAMASATVTAGGNFTLKDAAGGVVAGAVIYDGTSAIFTPDAWLVYDTTYTATLSFNMTDAAGNALSLYTFSFTTGSAPDVILPMVSSKTPGVAATNVSITSPVSVTFSEDMTAETINAATFKLSSSSGLVAGSGIGLGNTAIFTPNIPLAYGIVYTVTITTDVTDLAGNNMAAPNTWSFTTELEPDTTVPGVVVTTPINGASGIAATSNITASFSEAMLPASVTAAGSFTLKDAAGTTVGGTVTYDGTSAIFDPTTDLSYETTYTATLSWDMTDTAGNPLSLYTFSFTTGIAPDVTAPTVTGISPVTDAIDVSADAVVKATFSEAMDAGTINQYTITLKIGVNNVPGVVTYDGSLATFTPLEALEYSTLYTATITTGVTDTSGNNMASATVWTFTTMSAETAGDVLDTDGDGLSDVDEIGIYNTSPILADTDGDGWSDWKELVEYSFNPDNNPYRYNPLMADIPKIDINIAEVPDIQLHYTTVAGTSSTIGASRTEETSSATTESETFENSVSIEATVEAKASISPEVSASLSVGYEAGWSWTTEQTTENREAFEASETFEDTNEVATSEGHLSVAVEVVNNGHIAYTLNNLMLGAVMPDPNNPGEFKVISNLDLDTKYNSFPATTIAPGDKREALLFTRTIDTGTAKDLLGESRSLVFKVSSYELSNADGTPFAFNQTDIMAKTAKIVIDYNNYRPIETYHVATNAVPEVMSITVAEAMNSILNVPYVAGSILNGSTATYNAIPVTGLLSVRDNADAVLDYAKRGTWIVAHSYDDGPDRVTDIYDLRNAPYSYDFDNLVLKAGHALLLMYLDDTDLDGMFGREEFAMGSSNSSLDSDGDGFSDVLDPHPHYIGNNGYQIEYAYDFGAIIKTDGTLWMWGKNHEGQLGLGDYDYRDVPEQVGTMKWKQVALGSDHVVGIRDDGSLWTWGDNDRGQLGTTGEFYYFINQPSPVHIGGDSWRQVTAGNNFSVAIHSDGTLWAWGENTQGQSAVVHLGSEFCIDPATRNDYLWAAKTVEKPALVNGTITDWVKISAGYAHVAALRADGTIWSWGSNDYAVIALNTDEGFSCLSPIQDWNSKYSGLNWVDVSAGFYHTLAIRDDGSLHGVGLNTEGQLCMTSFDNAFRGNFTPVLNKDLDWVSIDAGRHNSVMRKSDGTLYSCGSYAFGQLAIGTVGANAEDVVQESTADRWAAVDAGKQGTIGVLYNGAIWGWGMNHDEVTPYYDPSQDFVESGFTIFPQ